MDNKSNIKGETQMDTQTNLEIKVILKTVYGRDCIYPACEKAKIFAEMLNQKTLTTREINYIKKLGYTITVVPHTNAQL